MVTHHRNVKGSPPFRAIPCRDCL